MSLRLVAVTAGVAVSFALHNFFAWGWWISVASGIIVLIALHPLVWAQMQMRNYGMLYALSFVTAVTSCLALHNQFGWGWLASASTGIVILVTLPFLIGIVLGIGDRRRMDGTIYAKNTFESSGLPTGFIDPPGPYGSGEELSAFLKELEGMPDDPQIRQARQQVQSYPKES